MFDPVLFRERDSSFHVLLLCAIATHPQLTKRAGALVSYWDSKKDRTAPALMSVTRAEERDQFADRLFRTGCTISRVLTTFCQEARSRKSTLPPKAIRMIEREAHV
jgi:hypothetical protein